MASSSKVIEVAKKEIGYLEKKSNSNLSSKTANAGSKNYTKYGQWMGMDGTYWCAEFVCWCFHTAYGDSTAKELLYGGYSASCETLRQRFDDKGAYHSSPKVGDLIFFSGLRHRGANHIGIVYKVSGGYVYTIEGNTTGASGVVDNGGGVTTKRYGTSYSRILGYGRPKYSGASGTKTSIKKTDNKKSTTTKTYIITAKSGLNMRSGTSVNNSKITAVPHGEKVKLVEKTTKTWWKVSWEGHTGYVLSKYLA